MDIDRKEKRYGWERREFAYNPLGHMLNTLLKSLTSIGKVSRKLAVSHISLDRHADLLSEARKKIS